MDYDVIVIGGGPGGSTASPSLAQRGHRVLLFERARFPRFHIGESLIPETYWCLKRLEHAAKMKASHFVKKYSVQFVKPERTSVGAVLLLGQQAARVLADLAGGAQRVRPDDARERRASTASRSAEGVRVLEVLFEGDRAVGVRVRATATATGRSGPRWSSTPAARAR